MLLNINGKESMRLASWFSITLTLVSINALAHKFEGDWHFIKGEYTTADGTLVESDSRKLLAVKSVRGDRFSLVNTKDGKFQGYLQGDFKVEGDEYSENVTDGSLKTHIGKSYQFKGWIVSKVEHGRQVDYWYHKGIVNGVEELEVWQRLGY